LQEEQQRTRIRALGAAIGSMPRLPPAPALRPGRDADQLGNPAPQASRVRPL